MVLPLCSTEVSLSKQWLRICTPELRAASTLNSNSSTKLVNSRPVQRKELDVFGTDEPTICRSSARYLAWPPCCCQPAKVLPSKSEIQPAASAFFSAASITGQSMLKSKRV